MTIFHLSDRQKIWKNKNQCLQECINILIYMCTHTYSLRNVHKSWTQEQRGIIFWNEISDIVFSLSFLQFHLRKKSICLFFQKQESSFEKQQTGKNKPWFYLSRFFSSLMYRFFSMLYYFNLLSIYLDRSSLVV